MTSSFSRPIAMLAAAVALAACHRGATASSPGAAPAPAAGTGAATMAKTTGVPSNITQAMIDSGKTLFGARCQRCHGPGGIGAPNGPNLADATWVQTDGSFDGIVKTIQTGVPMDKIKGGFQFAMRPMGGGTYTPEQVNYIAAYVYKLGHK